MSDELNLTPELTLTPETATAAAQAPAAPALTLDASADTAQAAAEAAQKGAYQAEAQGLNPFAMGLFLFGRFSGFLGWSVISGWYGVLVFGNIVRIGVNFLRVPVFVVVFAVYSVRVA